MTPKEVRAKWVAALRSGDYVQGKGKLQIVLKDNRSFCCLGILCDLAVKEGVIPEPILSTDDLGLGATPLLYNVNSIFVPDTVQEWAGLSTIDGTYSRNREDASLHTTSLTCNNDSGEYSFSDIADIIESEPEGLFVKENNE